jgi:hypothetical protein
MAGLGLLMVRGCGEFLVGVSASSPGPLSNEAALTRRRRLPNALRPEAAHSLDVGILVDGLRPSLTACGPSGLFGVL